MLVASVHLSTTNIQKWHEEKAMRLTRQQSIGEHFTCETRVAGSGKWRPKRCSMLNESCRVAMRHRSVSIHEIARLFGRKIGRFFGNSKAAII